MKVNILLDNPQGIRDGYLNIDPFANGDDCRVRDNIKTLDEVDCGEVEEILAFDVLHFFYFCEVPQILHGWAGKLKHSGQIALSFTDVYYSAKAIVNHAMSIDNINSLLYCMKTDQPWQLRRSILSMQYVADRLESFGLRILNKKYDNGKAFIRAMRE